MSEQTHVINCYAFEDIMGDSDMIHKYKTGRRCKYPKCETILSKFNPHDHCFVHVHKKIAEDNWADYDVLITGVQHGCKRKGYKKYTKKAERVLLPEQQGVRKRYQGARGNVK